MNTCPDYYAHASFRRLRSESLLPWVVGAFLLHGALLGLLVYQKNEIPFQPPVPIQVVLFDQDHSAEIPQASASAPPATQNPVPIQNPSRPKPQQVVAVQPKPVSEPVSSSTSTSQPVQVDSRADATATSEVTQANVTGTGTQGSSMGKGESGDGPVTGAQFDADYLRNPPPVYPPLSRRMGEEGQVLLRAYVLPDGKAETVEVKQGSGSPRLDQSALAAVRKWRFVPARKGKEPVAAWVVIPISFRLES